MATTDFTARCMAGKALDEVAGKQDVIPDLETIRAGAAAGTTAVQPAALSDYQSKIDSTHMLSADYVNDTSTTHKFATQTQLDQIELNKNNILLLEQMNGAKNLYKFEDLGATAGSGTGVTLTDNGDGTFTATGTASGANYARYLLKQAPIKAGVYIISGISGGALETYRLRVGTGSGDAYIVNLENNYAQFTIATDTTVTVQFVVNSGVTVTNLSIKPMIITKAMYDAGFTDYQPFALSNVELTAEVAHLVPTKLAELSADGTAEFAATQYKSICMILTNTSNYKTSATTLPAIFFEYGFKICADVDSAQGTAIKGTGNTYTVTVPSGHKVYIYGY